MVSMAAYDEKYEELEELKRVTKELAARLSEDSWADTENHQQMQELARMLYTQEKERILQEQEVECCLMRYSIPQAKKIWQLLIVNGVLEDYLVLSDEKQDLVYLYSDEKSEELLGQLIGGGI